MPAAVPGERPRTARWQRWLPNAITLLRIALVPLWLHHAFGLRRAALLGLPVEHALAALTFACIGASDLVDGMLARRWDVRTRLGAVLDAVADKLAQVVAVTFLSLWTSPAFAPLPLWLLGTLVARDALLGGGLIVAHLRQRRVDVEHRWHGKASSFLLFSLLVAVSAGLRGPAVPLVSAAVVLLVLGSTADYLRSGWRELSRPPRAKRP
jgi:cardiolipin synthase